MIDRRKMIALLGNLVDIDVDKEGSTDKILKLQSWAKDILDEKAPGSGNHHTLIETAKLGSAALAARTVTYNSYLFPILEIILQTESTASGIAAILNTNNIIKRNGDIDCWDDQSVYYYLRRMGNAKEL